MNRIYNSRRKGKNFWCFKNMTPGLKDRTIRPLGRTHWNRVNMIRQIIIMQPLLYYKEPTKYYGSKNRYLFILWLIDKNPLSQNIKIQLNCQLAQRLHQHPSTVKRKTLIIKTQPTKGKRLPQKETHRTRKSPHHPSLMYIFIPN